MKLLLRYQYLKKKIKVLQYLVPEVASKDQMGKSKEIYFFFGGGVGFGFGIQF